MLQIDLTRKAIYVAGGHLTDPHSSMTYVSVVSRYSVCLALFIALDILAGDIPNEYLNAPTRDKVFFYSGDEWRSDQGKVVAVVRSLYGLKYSA